MVVVKVRLMNTHFTQHEVGGIGPRRATLAAVFASCQFAAKDDGVRAGYCHFLFKIISIMLYNDAVSLRLLCVNEK
jgi:hypothetical protein